MKKRPATANGSKKRICPLSDPSLGIVSENDHKVGLCICRFCDCGEHKCPVLDKNEVYLKSTFHSSYMKSYKPISFDTPLKLQQKLFRPNKGKMDLQTTNQADFKPFRVMPKDCEKVQSANSNAKFRGVSQYSNDYPDWGGNSITHEKHWHAPLRSTEIAFKGKSSYNESFNDSYNNSCSKSLNSIKASDLAASKSTISFGPKGEFNGTTTYTSEIGKYSGSNLNQRVVVVAKAAPKVKTTLAHFLTTSKSYFKGGEFPADPRLFRQALIARSSSVQKDKKRK